MTATLLERIMQSSVGKKIQREEDDLISSQRESLVAQLADLEAEELKGAPKLQAAVEKAREARDKAKLALRGAEQQLQTAISASSRASGHFSQQRSDIERELWNTADPAIDEFVERLGDLLRQGRSWFQSWTETVQTAGGTKLVNRGNSLQVNARLAGIREAISQAEALKLKVVDDVAGELVKIESAIPALEEAPQTEAAS